MSDESLGRQLLPVKLEITSGEPVDRQYWAGRITGWLNNNCACAALHHHEVGQEVICIYPDANNE